MPKLVFTFLTLCFLFLSCFSQQSGGARITQLIEERKLDEAMQLAQSTLSSLDPSRDSEAYLSTTTQLIHINIKKGAYSEGLEVGRNLIASYSELVSTTSLAVSKFYAALGEVAYHTQSNEKAAIDYLNYAYDKYQALKKSEPLYESNLLELLANGYYYKGKYSQAIEVMEKSIALLNPERDQKKLAILLRSLGNYYWGLKAYDEAARYYDQSLAILYQTDPVDSLKIGKVLHAKGYIYMNQESFQLAYETFREASTLISNVHAPVSSPVVWVYGDVGRALIDLERYEEALVWLQKALNANVFEYKQEDYYQNPPLKSINDDFQHFMILKLKGQAFLKKYLLDSNERDLKGMIDCFRLADQQVDNIRRDIPDAKDQSTITYYAIELYSNAIEALVAVSQKDSNPDLLELAHYFMEKQKITRVHLNFLEASAKAENLLPTELRDQDREMLADMVELKNTIRKQLTDQGDSVDVYKNMLFAAEEEYEQFVSDIKRDYPLYHAARFNLEVASIEEIQQYLGRDAPKRAIITYYEFGKKLRTSVITKDTFLMNVKRHGQNLPELVNEFRKSLISPDSNETRAPVLDTLLTQEPLTSITDINKITFVLDPALQLIPMELIVYQDQFLFEQYDISYHYSATLSIQKRKQKKNLTDFIGFAPSFDDTEFSGLPGAIKEVESIAEELGGVSYLDERATESTLKKAVMEAGLLHLATHAEVNESNPENSFLALSNHETDEDGRLHFYEIYDLELQAQLVTLSACNSGYGKIERGEGIMSLSRAFSLAGVPSTAVSLWPASDKSTPELMKYFYQNLKEGQPKDVALNNARKQYLETAQGKARHPFYWGGFVLIGDNDPIKEERNLLVYTIAAALIIVMILTLYRRKNNAA